MPENAGLLARTMCRIRLLELLSQSVAPPLRFFRGTPKLFDLMLRYAGKTTVVECGIGNGDTTRELRLMGIDVLAIDICRRETQPPDTVILDAASLRYGPSQWPLICRPDHSGWAYDVIHSALRSGAPAVYVGLEVNYARDVGDLDCYVVEHHRDVGKEGECLWLFKGELD